MNSQIKSTYDRIVDLLNHAALMSNSVEKITNLKIVEELIINKEPSLLDNFLEEMLAFQTDNSVDVKKYIIHFMTVAGKTDAELLPKIVSSMKIMMFDDNVNIVKIVVLNLSHVFKAVLKWLATSHPITESMNETWNVALLMIQAVNEFIDSENEGLRSNAIKFLEVVVLALSKPSDDPELIRPSNNKGPAYQDDVNLSLVPANHQMLKSDRLESEGKKCFDRLLSYQSSTHISSINLITAMSSMTTIAKLRPVYLGEVVQGFESLHVDLPPTLTKSQVSSVRKQLKMQLLAILRLPSAAEYQSNIAILLSDLGASQSEILKSMPKGDNSRKRKAESNENNSKKARMDQIALKNFKKQRSEGENSMDYDDIPQSFPASTKPPPTNQLQPSTAKTTTPTDNPVEDVSKHHSAIDITANDLVPNLTPMKVTDLVLASMKILPDQMPALFQSTYTPIAAAGTSIQIKHLARLLAAQLTNAKLGKGYEMEERRKLEEARRKAEEEAVKLQEAMIVTDEQSIDTVVCGVVTSREECQSMAPTNEIKIEKEEPVPQVAVVQPIRKRPAQFNIERALEPMTREEMTAHACYLSEKLLASRDVGIVNDSKRVMNVKICSSSKDIRDEYFQRIFADLKNLRSLAMSLIFDEYLNYKTTSMKSSSSSPPTEDETKRSLEKYEESVLVILGEILKRLDQLEEEFFHNFIFELPLLTPDIVRLLEETCMNKLHFKMGLATLKDLILKRPLHRAECLDLLLSISTNENSEKDIRKKALDAIKDLYVKPELEKAIESHAMKHLNYLLSPDPPREFSKGSDEDVAWSEEPIKMCLHLYLALLPTRHKLIHELASVYTNSSSEIKRVILRVIETPVKGMGMDSPELLLLVENCPKGAETLVTRVIHILTDKVVPSPELVKKVRDLYQRRVSDVRFLIPVLNGLTKEEVIAALPKLVKLNPVVVKEVFNRLLGVNGQECRPTSLSPTELLVTLHTLDPAKADMKAIIKACNLCFAEKSVYTQEVLASVMQQLMDLNPLPTLLMRTVIQSLATYPKLSGFVLNVLQRLIAKQVWRNKKVWEGFVKCCQRTRPQSFQVLLQLPPVQLKDSFVMCPDLREPLLSHVNSLTPHQRAHIPKAIMSVLEKSPVGMPQGTPEQTKPRPGEGDERRSRGGLKVCHQSNIFAPNFENSPRSGHLKEDADMFEGGLVSEEEEEQGGVVNA